MVEEVNPKELANQKLLRLPNQLADSQNELTQEYLQQVKNVLLVAFFDSTSFSVGWKCCFVENRPQQTQPNIFFSRKQQFNVW